MSWEDIDIHTLMLADTVRTESFRTAIERIVRPGMRVLDLGCGSGILSFFSERAGAASVYAVDKSPFIKVARAVAKRNGFTRIQFIKTEGGDFELPEKVDVIVSECLGHYVFTDAMLPILFRSRDRHLVEGGAIIPSSIELIAAMVLDPPVDERLQFFDQPRYGIDFAPMRELARGRWRKRRFDVASLGPFLSMGDIDLHKAVEEPQITRARFNLESPLTVHGLAGWFNALLAPECELRTGPDSPPTRWDQVYFPLQTPVTVEGKGEVSICPVRSRVGAMWRWSIRWSGGMVENDDLVQLHLISPS